MKLPPDSIIAHAKITHYLLKWQARGDKSEFLRIAGYDLLHPERLIHDLRTQVLVREAVVSEVTEHGQFYEIFCRMTGPNGRSLDIRIIWMREHLSGQTKFITLIPERNLKNDY